MTPEERAAKIRGIIARWALSSARIEDPELLVEIAAEIRAAVEDQIEHGLKMVKAQRKMALAEAFEEAAKILAMLAGAKRQCADTNDGHDDRWCSVCENMSDAYEYAESQIRALAKGLK